MNRSLTPAELFVGPTDRLISTVEELLQTLLCKQETAGKSCFCTDCRAIKNRQHVQLLWIKPEKDYKVQDLDGIFARISFARSDDEPFFFVLESADTFNASTGNRLLKILEEPTAGYRFLLLTNNEQALLPTIVSRCHIIHLQAQHDSQVSSPLLAFFIDPTKKNDPFGFEATLKQLALSDSQSRQLAYQLMTLLFKKSTSEDESTAWSFYVDLVLKALQKPPQSGSSDIFWKNLYLQFHTTV